MCNDIKKSMVWGGVKVGDGTGDGFKVRDRVSLRAKGWLGFMYYGLKLFELKLRSGGGFGKKNKIVQRIIHFFPVFKFFFL